MKPKAEHNRTFSRACLTAANITWRSFNFDTHWKIGIIDFWPTSLKWIDSEEDVKGEGVMKLINHLREKNPLLMANQKGEVICKILSVDQMFNIAAHSKEKSLIGICRTLHKEIYG